MATKNTPVYLGSTLEVKVGIEVSNNAFHLADETTDFTAEFYIQGKQDKGSVVLEKSELYINEDEPDYFVAHVPTDGFELGQLCCTVDGTYKDEEHGVNDVPFVHSITVPVEVKKKYL